MPAITADLLSGYCVRISNGRHTWRADEPTDVGGTDEGPTPYELLLGALAACTCITLSMYAQRKGIPLDSVSTRYTYEKVHADDCAGCEEREQKLDELERVLEVEGPLDDDQRARLLEIAEKCPVHRTLLNEKRIPTRYA